MSNEAQAVALHHSQASGTDKVIMIAIANYAGEDGAWCSIPTLAKIANVTEESARRAVRRLEQLGEIETERNGGYGAQLKKPKHTRTNLYHVTLRCPEWCDRSMQHRDTREFKSGPSSTSAPRQRRADVNEGPGPSSTSGEPVYEPQPIGNHVPRSGESRASERDDDDQPKDPYADLSPGEKQQLARRRMIEAREQPAPRARYTPPPAPTVPRYDPSSEPRKPPALDAEQQAANALAVTYRCEQGIAPRFTHAMLIATGEGCAHCGKSTGEILEENTP